MAHTEQMMINGVLTDVTVFDSAAQEIDDAVAALAAMGGASLGAGTVKLDGQTNNRVSITSVGWYRLMSFSGGMHSALVHVRHNWTNGSPSDLLIYVCVDQYMPAVNILSSGYYKSNVTPVDDVRLTRSASNDLCYLDIHYSLSVGNSIGFNVLATAPDPIHPVNITRLDAVAVAAAPDGETVLTQAAWSNPPEVLGVEYRTTKRYLGKPVYAKIVDCGLVPSGVKSLSMGYSDAQVQVINVEAAMKTSGGVYYTAPMTTESYTVSVNASGSAIVIYSNSSNFASYTMYAKLEYAKTTD